MQYYNRNSPMSEVELQEQPQIKGFYFEFPKSYPFHLYRDRLVVYNYDNQEEHVIELTHDQVLAFLMNVVNTTRTLELDGDAEYDGTWLSGTLEEATRKYNVMIEANNAAARNAAGPAEGGKHRHHKKRKSHKRSGKKRSGKKRSGKSHKRRKSHKRSGKSRRH